MKTNFRMNTQELNRERKRLDALLEQRRVVPAIALVGKLVDESGSWDLRKRLDAADEAYRALLAYVTRGVDDPGRDGVLCRITSEIDAIADLAIMAQEQETSPQVFYQRRRELGSVPLQQVLTELQQCYQRTSLVEQSPQPDDNSMLQSLQESERAETRLFNKIWSTYPMTQDDASLLKEAIATGSITEPAQCLVVAALLVGLMKFYDAGKVALLAEVYLSEASQLVRVRALTGLLLVLMVYRRRTTSENVRVRLEAVAEVPEVADDVAMVHQALVRARNTDNVTRSITRELIPDILKMRDDIIKRQKEAEQKPQEADMDTNPEWERLLEQTGMADKIERFSQLQVDGNDVFISTFAHLKSFPFFKTLSNWFLPFHTRQSAVWSTFKGSDGLRTAIVDAPFLCDSDKYSFCLSLTMMPETQRNMTMSQFQSQQSEMAAMQDELPDKRQQCQAIVTRYVQNLYRFFKIFSRRSEFARAMDGDMDLLDLPVVGDIASLPRNTQVIAEFYFKNAFYPDAIRYYERYLERSADPAIITYQKMGYAYQSMGDYKRALEMYGRYELADEDNVWNLRHIAVCHRELGDTDRAVAYFERALALRPDNVGLSLSMGHCLLAAGRTTEALQYYYKADLLPDAGHRAWRPIAWASLVSGDLDRSEDYYRRIDADDKLTAQDWLNWGHVALCRGDVATAVARYTHAVPDTEQERPQFGTMLLRDRAVLESNGVKASDLPLVVDAVLASAAGLITPPPSSQ